MTSNCKRPLIIVVITVILLALAFYRIDLMKVRRVFSHINYLYLVPAWRCSHTWWSMV